MNSYEVDRGTTRVTISVPSTIVESADRLARLERRSRSWVFSEAVARYLSRPGEPSPDFGGADTHAPVFEAARVDRLRGDLALTPEERVREIESIVRAAEALHREPRAHEIVVFDSWEDYLTWKRRVRLP